MLALDYEEVTENFQNTAHFDRHQCITKWSEHNPESLYDGKASTAAHDGVMARDFMCYLSALRS